MRSVVIVGWRSKTWKHSAPNDSSCSAVVRSLIEDMQQAAMLNAVRVSSVGCDAGIGAVVKGACATYGVPFVEFKVVFEGGSPTAGDYLSGYVARHAALLELGTEFHIFVSASRRSTVEDLVRRVQQTEHPYKVYNERGEVLEVRERLPAAEVTGKKVEEVSQSQLHQRSP